MAGLTVPLAVAAPAAAQTGTFAYDANFLSDDVSVIDTATNTVTATIPVGDAPRDAVVSQQTPGDLPQAIRNDPSPPSTPHAQDNCQPAMQDTVLAVMVPRHDGRST